MRADRRTNMVIVFCLIGTAQRFANCKICAVPLACVSQRALKMSQYLARGVKRWYHPDEDREFELTLGTKGSGCEEQKPIKTRGPRFCQMCLMSFSPLKTSSDVCYILSPPLSFVISVVFPRQAQPAPEEFSELDSTRPRGKKRPNKPLEPLRREWGGDGRGGMKRRDRSDQMRWWNERRAVIWAWWDEAMIFRMWETKFTADVYDSRGSVTSEIFLSPVNSPHVTIRCFVLRALWLRFGVNIHLKTKLFCSLLSDTKRKTFIQAYEVLNLLPLVSHWAEETQNESECTSTTIHPISRPWLINSAFINEKHDYSPNPN